MNVLHRKWMKTKIMHLLTFVFYFIPSQNFHLQFNHFGVYVWASKYICTYVCICKTDTATRRHTHIYISIYVCTRLYWNACMCCFCGYSMCVCVSVCVTCTRTYLHARKFERISIHTYINAHISTYEYVNNFEVQLWTLIEKVL